MIDVDVEYKHGSQCEHTLCAAFLHQRWACVSVRAADCAVRTKFDTLVSRSDGGGRRNYNVARGNRVFFPRATPIFGAPDEICMRSKWVAILFANGQNAGGFDKVAYIHASEAKLK